MLLFDGVRATFAPTFSRTLPEYSDAELAEPVDAMVSNTIVRKDMPVRVRRSVLRSSSTMWGSFLFWGVLKTNLASFRAGNWPDDIALIGHSVTSSSRE
jgi:hypothetical protein